MAASAIGSEENATSSAFAQSPSIPPAPVPNKRSCVVCRKRKVRCDKRSPCSNCRRANIPCIVPSVDRPPRWARGLEQIPNNAAAAAAALSLQGDDDRMGDTLNRLRNLEKLVKDLGCKLEEARAAAGQARSGLPEDDHLQRPELSSGAEHHMDTSTVADGDNSNNEIGRLLLQDASHSHHVGSRFWSCISDEIEGLKLEARELLTDNELDASEDEVSSEKATTSHATLRKQSEQHAFLLRQDLMPSLHDNRQFHPPQSQIHFLLDVFNENVNVFLKVAHIPSITKMIREAYIGNTPRFTPANEALIFSIYYVAVISMEEEDVLTSFGVSKTDISLKFRLGLETALAKANLLNVADIVLVQALSIFLYVGRQSESPMYVWMMTGLVIRMAQFLNLQRDGSHFKHLTPFEIEMRRRLWWLIRLMDLRSSEDQGTDLAVLSNHTDTKIPLNINDTDLDPLSNQMPEERDGVTDMSFTRMFIGLGEIMMQMTACSSSKDGVAVLEHQSFLLNELYRRYEQGYLKHEKEWDSIAYWVSVTIARLSMAKMKLTMFLPVLFSTSGCEVSETVRTTFLVCAIEVAEYNHELNTNKACHKWRWLFQTYTQWSSIVYLSIEIARRPWSPLVERAWMALHSSWLIPAQITEHENSRVWIPIRNLIAKARKHRDAELRRLQADPQAAALLEMEDQEAPQPSSSGLFPTGSSDDMSRKWWRSLITTSDTRGWNTQTQILGVRNTAATEASMHTSRNTQPAVNSRPVLRHQLSPNAINDSPDPGVTGQHVTKTVTSTESIGLKASLIGKPVDPRSAGEASGGPSPAISANWFDHAMGPGSLPWLWARDRSEEIFTDIAMSSGDGNVDSADEVNWLEWIESAKGIV